MEPRGNYNQKYQVEAFTQAQPVISTDHEFIHLGMGYVASVFAEGVADDAAVMIEFKTPATEALGVVHLKEYKPWGSGGVNKLEIIEAPTLTTGNAAITPANRNRVGTPADSAATLKSNPTSISAGTTIEGPMAFGGGGSGRGAGGNSTSDQEIVLKPNTTYLIKATNLSGGAAALGIWIFWYEEK